MNKRGNNLGMMLSNRSDMLRSNTMPTSGMKSGISGGMQVSGGLQEQQKMFSSGSNLYDNRGSMGFDMDDNVLGGFGNHHNSNNFPHSNYGNGGMHGNNMYRNTAPNFMRPSQQQQGQQSKNNFSIWLQSNTRGGGSSTMEGGSTGNNSHHIGGGINNGVDRRSHSLGTRLHNRFNNHGGGFDDCDVNGGNSQINNQLDSLCQSVAEHAL